MNDEWIYGDFGQNEQSASGAGDALWLYQATGERTYYDYAVNQMAPPADLPPAVSITAPGAGATLSGSITLSASASDTGGVVSLFYRVDNGSTVSMTQTSGSSLSGQWSAGLDTTQFTDGVHTITVIATDTASQPAIEPLRGRQHPQQHRAENACGAHRRGACHQELARAGKVRPSHQGRVWRSSSGRGGDGALVGSRERHLQHHDRFAREGNGLLELHDTAKRTQLHLQHRRDQQIRLVV